MAENSVKNILDNSQDYKRFAALSAFAMLSANSIAEDSPTTRLEYPQNLEYYLPGSKGKSLAQKVEAVLELGLGKDRLAEIRLIRSNGAASDKKPIGDELKFIEAIESELPDNIKQEAFKRQLRDEDFTSGQEWLKQPIGKDSTEYLENHGKFLHQLTTSAFRLMDTTVDKTESGKEIALMGKVASHSRNVARAMTEATYAIKEQLGEDGADWQLDKASATITALSGLLLDMGRPLLFHQAEEAFKLQPGRIKDKDPRPTGITWETLHSEVMKENDIRTLFYWMKGAIVDFITYTQKDGLFKEEAKEDFPKIAEEIIFENIRGGEAPLQDSKAKIFSDFVNAPNRGYLKQDTGFTDIGMFFSAIQTFHANNIEFITRSPILAGVRASAYHNVDFRGNKEAPDKPSHAYPHFMGQVQNQNAVRYDDTPDKILTEIQGEDMSLHHELFRLMDKFVSRIEKDPAPGSFWRAIITHIVSEHTYGQSAHPGLLKFLAGDLSDPENSVLGKVAISVIKEANPTLTEEELNKRVKAVFNAHKGTTVKELNDLFERSPTKESRFWTGITTDDVKAIEKAGSLQAYIKQKFGDLAVEFRGSDVDADKVVVMANRPTGWAHRAETQGEAVDTLRKHSDLVLADYAKGSPALTGTHA